MHADLIATLSQHLSAKGCAKLRRLYASVCCRSTFNVVCYVTPVIAECCVKDNGKILINRGFIVKYNKNYFASNLFYDVYEYYKYGYDTKLFNIEKNYYRKLYNTHYFYNNRQYGYERDLLSDSTYVIIDRNIDGYDIFILLFYGKYKITIYKGDNILLQYYKK